MFWEQKVIRLAQTGNGAANLIVGVAGKRIVLDYIYITVDTNAVILLLDNVTAFGPAFYIAASEAVHTGDNLNLRASIGTTVQATITNAGDTVIYAGYHFEGAKTNYLTSDTP
jgi:hypothetical protein